MTYSTSVKNARMQAVVTEMGASSRLEIGTAGMASVLVTIPLDAVPGTVSNGVLTLSGFPKSDASADASGFAAEARIVRGDNTPVKTGLTVGTSGTAIVLDSVNINAGQAVTISSATITHAA